VHAETDSCYRCCRDNRGECEPYQRLNFAPYRLQEGTRCIHGICDAKVQPYLNAIDKFMFQGVCKKESVDVVQHIWKILVDLDKNTFCTSLVFLIVT
jgi:hypothetical protein